MDEPTARLVTSRIGRTHAPFAKAEKQSEDAHDHAAGGEEAAAAVELTP